MRVGHDEGAAWSSARRRPGPELRSRGLVEGDHAGAIDCVDDSVRDGRLADKRGLALPAYGSGGEIEPDQAPVMDRDHVAVLEHDRREVHAPAVPPEVGVRDEDPLLTGATVEDIEAGRVGS